MKLGGEVAGVKTAPTDFRIGPVTTNDARAFGEVIVTGFGTPGTPLSDMIAASVGAPNSYPFSAWDGDTMVAGGVLLVHGEVGALHSASTLPEYPTIRWWRRVMNLVEPISRLFEPAISGRVLADGAPAIR